MTDTYFADVSSWQTVATSAYPHPILSFRVDFGTGIDGNARANWGFCQASPTIKAAIGYVVFKPGQGDAILRRVIDFFGPTPPKKLVMMIDMESGSEFAGPGDHSPGANALAQGFAKWLGDERRVIGYANGNDWSLCWPTRPAWLKRITASYGTQDPGSWGWQYYGGDTRWPSPAGYPRSCPPFGAIVDMNVIHRSVTQILVDCGLLNPAPIPAPTKPTTTPTKPSGGTVDATTAARIEAKLDTLLGMFNGAGDDQQPHSVEYIVAHVVHGHQYRSGKGIDWTKETP